MKKSSGKIQAWGPSIAVRVGLGEQQQKRLSEAGQDVISAQNGSGLPEISLSWAASSGRVHEGVLCESRAPG
jgi:hypothetical protein